MNGFIKFAMNFIKFIKMKMRRRKKYRQRCTSTVLFMFDFRSRRERKRPGWRPQHYWIATALHGPRNRPKKSGVTSESVPTDMRARKNWQVCFIWTCLNEYCGHSVEADILDQALFHLNFVVVERNPSFWFVRPFIRDCVLLQ